MEKDHIVFLLPKRIPILKDKPNQVIKTSYEEISLYFKNMLHPYHESWDIHTLCDYGRNYGDRWMINAFPYDIDSFPLTIQVYDEYGKLLCEKTTVIELYDKAVAQKPFYALCVGDSMTRSQVWIQHIAMKLSYIRFIGSRSYNKTIYHEGRGGWSFGTYYQNTTESPFMYPEGVDGKTYFGDIAYARKVNDPDHDSYSYDGYDPLHLRAGQIYHEDGKLYQALEDSATLQDVKARLYSDTVVWQLDFCKYMAHFDLQSPDMLTILMGANDLQIGTYDETPARIETFMQNMQRFVDAVRAYSKTLPIVINLPIIGADQYSWGTQLGNRGGAKIYDYQIKLACEQLLARYDGREDENLYISPMECAIDPVYGFPTTDHTTGRYSTEKVFGHANWVHPSTVGYNQMGDALCGTMEKLRAAQNSGKA